MLLRDHVNLFLVLTRCRKHNPAFRARFDYLKTYVLGTWGWYCKLQVRMQVGKAGLTVKKPMGLKPQPRKRYTVAGKRRS